MSRSYGESGGARDDSSSQHCAQMQADLSAWFDGELGVDEKPGFDEKSGTLPADQRAESAAVPAGLPPGRLGDHLAACAACRSELDAMRTVSRAARAVPVALSSDAFSDGFAARIRDAAVGEDSVGAPNAVPESHGRWRKGPTVMTMAAVALAAAALFVVALVVVYDLGQRHGREALAQVSPQAQQQGSTQSPTGTSPVGTAMPAIAFDSPSHVRAARSVASDLGVIERIPKPLRRPLLRAQIDHFELDRWAKVVRRQPVTPPSVRDLADLIETLVVSLDTESRFGAELATIRAQAMRPSIWAAAVGEQLVTVDIRGVRARRSDTVREAAKHMATAMSAGQRSELGRILEFKEHFAAGNPWPLIALDAEANEIPADFRPSVEAMLAASFGAAGLDEIAAPWMRPLREGSPEVFRLLSQTVFDGRDPVRVEVGGRELQERLQSLLQTSKGSGEVVIQESTESGGYSLQVFIRSAPGEVSIKRETVKRETVKRETVKRDRR
ncbi:MAG: hypothetical protein AB8H80_17820 [Planctomycetota bacterium]